MGSKIFSQKEFIKKNLKMKFYFSKNIKMKIVSEMKSKIDDPKFHCVKNHKLMPLEANLRLLTGDIHEVRREKPIKKRPNYHWCDKAR